jgi:hypothetical protein
MQEQADDHTYGRTGEEHNRHLPCDDLQQARLKNMSSRMFLGSTSFISHLCHFTAGPLRLLVILHLRLYIIICVRLPPLLLLPHALGK